MSQEQFERDVMQELYDEDQAALPEHKRDGYAEKMSELADIKRKEERENFNG